MATLTVRTDDEIDAALTFLMEEMHEDNKSVVVRKVLIAASEEARRARARAEVDALVASESDQAALREVREDMDAVRAW